MDNKEAILCLSSMSILDLLEPSSLMVWANGSIEYADGVHAVIPPPQCLTQF